MSGINTLGSSQQLFSLRKENCADLFLSTIDRVIDLLDRGTIKKLTPDETEALWQGHERLRKTPFLNLDGESERVAAAFERLSNRWSTQSCESASIEMRVRAVSLRAYQISEIRRDPKQVASAEDYVAKWEALGSNLAWVHNKAALFTAAQKSTGLCSPSQEGNHPLNEVIFNKVGMATDYIVSGEIDPNGTPEERLARGMGAAAYVKALDENNEMYKEYRLRAAQRAVECLSWDGVPQVDQYVLGKVIGDMTRVIETITPPKKDCGEILFG